jgi:hypothetical protein
MPKWNDSRPTEKASVDNTDMSFFIKKNPVVFFQKSGENRYVRKVPATENEACVSTLKLRDFVFQFFMKAERTIEDPRSRARSVLADSLYRRLSDSRIMRQTKVIVCPKRNEFTPVHDNSGCTRGLASPEDCIGCLPLRRSCRKRGGFAKNPEALPTVFFSAFRLPVPSACPSVPSPSLLNSLVAYRSYERVGLSAIGFSFESKNCPVTASVTRKALLSNDLRRRHCNRTTRKREPNICLLAC